MSSQPTQPLQPTQPIIVSSFPEISLDSLLAVQFDRGSLQDAHRDLLQQQVSELKATHSLDQVKVAVATLAELGNLYDQLAISHLPTLKDIIDFALVYRNKGATEQTIEEDLAGKIYDAATERNSHQENADDDENLGTPRLTVLYALALSRSGQLQSIMQNSEESHVKTPFDALMFAIKENRDIEHIDASGLTDKNTASASDTNASADHSTKPYQGSGNALAKLEDIPTETRRTIGLKASELQQAITVYSLNQQDIDDLRASTDGSAASARAALALYDAGHSPKAVALAVAVEATLSLDGTTAVRIRELHSNRPMTDREREVFESDRGVVDMTVYQMFVDQFGLDSSDLSPDNDIAEAIEWAVREFGKGRSPNVESALREAVKASVETGITTIDKLRANIGLTDEELEEIDSED